MRSYFTVGYKIFCFFKKLIFPFLDEGTFQECGAGEGERRGSQALEIFLGGGFHIKRGEVNISGGLIPWRILCIKQW